MKTALLTGNRTRYMRLLVLLAAAAVCGCAKQGMPSGGPKDVTPPATRQCRPENGTLNFDSKSIYIEFDEYVTIKDADNNILVSPPLANKPQYSTKGKGILVKLADTLQPNTTYLFQFKNAIADFNEGNLLPSLEYVFSTGATLDSMTLRGRVIDALTQKARKETVTVLLFDATDADSSAAFPASDSTVTAKAVYVTRCDTNGDFSFNYIRRGTYFVAAMEDNNKNMAVDAGEPAGFAVGRYSSFAVGDSLVRDSITFSSADANRVLVNLSESANETQRLTSSGFVRQGVVRLTTFLPMAAPQIETGGEETVWHLNGQRDTLTLWCLREECDSLQLLIADSSGLSDTLTLRWRPKKGVKTLNGSFVKLNHQTQLPCYDTLWLLMEIPLDTAAAPLDSVATVMNLSDSNVTVCAVLPDSNGLRARIDFSFREGAGYQLTVAKGTLRNIYGHENDSLTSKITVTKAEDYGNINITLVADSTLQSPLIAELVSDKDAVVARRLLSGAGRVAFGYLKPAKYRLRIIVDSNGNGKWDGGDYRLGRQPERVVYFRKTIDVRANWDFEEQMEL